MRAIDEVGQLTLICTARYQLIVTNESRFVNLKKKKKNASGAEEAGSGIRRVSSVQPET